MSSPHSPMCPVPLRSASKTLASLTSQCCPRGFHPLVKLDAATPGFPPPCLGPCSPTPALTVTCELSIHLQRPFQTPPPPEAFAPLTARSMYFEPSWDVPHCVGRCLSSPVLLASPTPPVPCKLVSCVWDGNRALHVESSPQMSVLVHPFCSRFCLTHSPKRFRSQSSHTLGIIKMAMWPL